MSEYLDKAFTPAKLGTLPLKNRIIKAATFEGKSPDGAPGMPLRNFHREMVAGGVAMTTIGYCTTEADGRINDHYELTSSMAGLKDRRAIFLTRGKRPAGLEDLFSSITRLPSVARLRPTRPPEVYYALLLDGYRGAE